MEVLVNGDVFSDPTGNSYEVFKDDVDDGGFGCIYFVKNQTGEKMVAKLPNLTKTPPQHNESTCSEVKCQTCFIFRKQREEANILKELQSLGVENVIGYIDCFEATINGKDVPVLLIPIAQGITVTEWIQKNGAMSEEHVKVFLEKLSIAVQGVHGANLIHRDIKSPNVFIDGALDDPIVTLIDFGISAQFDNSSTHAIATNICHSAFYAPPEQATHNEARPCTDIFAIGAMGYELLVGRDCRSGHPGGAKGRYNPRMDGPKNIDGDMIISEDMMQIITKATWDNPGHRYKLIDEFIMAVRGKPMIKNMPRIIADNKECVIDEDEIWICRKHDGLSNMKRIFVTERTDPKSRDRYISRFHAVIKKGRDGMYKIYDEGYDRPTGGDRSANGTVWRRENSSEWRHLPANGLPLHQHYMEIGLGYTDQVPNAVDAGGKPILPGAYTTIVYAPPDNFDTDA